MSEFKKFDAGKPRGSLLPVRAKEEIIKVLKQGAVKYGELNWYDNADQVKYTRYMDALERHLDSFKKGHDIDLESGCYELAHMAVNIIFLLEMQIKGLGVDNRPWKD